MSIAKQLSTLLRAILALRKCMAQKGDRFLAVSFVLGIQSQFMEFVGMQEVGVPGYPAFAIYNLTEDIEGHPAHSTLSRETILDCGFVLPEEAP
jgi:hypothetical protein